MNRIERAIQRTLAEELTADDLRERFERLGGYRLLFEEHLDRLTSLVDLECIYHNLYEEGVELYLPAFSTEVVYGDPAEPERITAAFIRVDGSYFEGREAISFNGDGFVGFAGWASTKNVLPFYRAFSAWLDDFEDLDLPIGRPDFQTQKLRHIK